MIRINQINESAVYYIPIQLVCRIFHKSCLASLVDVAVRESSAIGIDFAVKNSVLGVYRAAYSRFISLKLATVAIYDDFFFTVGACHFLVGELHASKHGVVGEDAVGDKEGVNNALFPIHIVYVVRVLFSRGLIMKLYAILLDTTYIVDFLIIDSNRVINKVAPTIIPYVFGVLVIHSH